MQLLVGVILDLHRAPSLKALGQIGNQIGLRIGHIEVFSGIRGILRPLRPHNSLLKYVAIHTIAI
jgi:hypothetical protein